MQDFQIGKICAKWNLKRFKIILTHNPSFFLNYDDTQLYILHIKQIFKRGLQEVWFQSNQ